jgi:hypothetical protein
VTILEQYAPETYATNAEQVYSFTFPAADPSVVEVYENVAGEDFRYLIPVADYQLTFAGTFDLPILTQGTVTFNVPHREGTTSINIERNTLIAQTVSLPAGGRQQEFRENIIEFTLDKAMMICQELSQRKCDVVVNTAMTQELIFGPYDTFSAALVNFQVNKTFVILQEIDASAEDCRATPEET